MRHAVFANGNFNLHAGVVNLTQHFLDATHWLPKQSRRLDQFNHHHLPWFGRSRSPFGDQYILPITFVFRSHQPHAALLQQATNNGLWWPLDYFNDPSLRSSLAVAAHDSGFDPVLVQHSAHLIGRQINIGPAIIARHKTMAIAMALNGSFNFVQQTAGLVHILDIISFFLKCPGGGIGRRTSFRY